MTSVIRNEAQHRKALARIEELWGAKARTPEGQELDLLMVLVDHYESEHLEPLPPDPIEAIRFRMDQMGINAAELAEMLELTRGRVSEILDRQRSLTLEHIRRLEGIGVPVDILVMDYELAKGRGRRSSR